MNMKVNKLLNNEEFLNFFQSINPSITEYEAAKVFKEIATEYETAYVFKESSEYETA